jgi:hypothetical protein
MHKHKKRREEDLVMMKDRDIREEFFFRERSFTVS